VSMVFIATAFDTIMLDTRIATIFLEGNGPGEIREVETE
jgi:hypothetical protein